MVQSDWKNIFPKRETCKFGLRYCLRIPRKAWIFLTDFQWKLPEASIIKIQKIKRIYSENYIQLVLTQENFTVLLFEIYNET